jgi:hypothetical protein
MSLVHLVVTEFRGYDLFTLYFDDRDDTIPGSDNPFVKFEKEFISKKGDYYYSHPEDTFGQSYYGYFVFPLFSAEEIFTLYRNKCESKPSLGKRYNIFFDQEHVQLEEMIKKFDRPLEEFIKETHKLRNYSHRLEYFDRSIQILRDMQTTIYETETNIAEVEHDFHKRFLASKAEK